MLGDLAEPFREHKTISHKCMLRKLTNDDPKYICYRCDKNRDDYGRYKCLSEKNMTRPQNHIAGWTCKKDEKCEE